MKTATRTLTILATAVALLFSISTAHAEQICLPRDAALEQLGQNFGEQAMGRGLAAGGQAIIELFVSRSGTWTVIVTDTRGVSCLVASGEGWSALPLLVGEAA